MASCLIFDRCSNRYLSLTDHFDAILKQDAKVYDLEEAEEYVNGCDCPEDYILEKIEKEYRLKLTHEELKMLKHMTHYASLKQKGNNEKMKKLAIKVHNKFCETIKDCEDL